MTKQTEKMNAQKEVQIKIGKYSDKLHAEYAKKWLDPQVKK